MSCRRCGGSFPTYEDGVCRDCFDVECLAQEKRGLDSSGQAMVTGVLEELLSYFDRQVISARFLLDVFEKKQNYDGQMAAKDLITSYQETIQIIKSKTINKGDMEHGE